MLCWSAPDTLTKIRTKNNWCQKKYRTRLCSHASSSVRTKVEGQPLLPKCPCPFYSDLLKDRLNWPRQWHFNLTQCLLQAGRTRRIGARVLPAQLASSCRVSTPHGETPLELQRCCRWRDLQIRASRQHDTVFIRYARWLHSLLWLFNWIVYCKSIGSASSSYLN